MLNVIMKESIEKKTKDLVQSNAFLKKAASGALTQNEVALYLHNLIHVFGQTPADLRIGANRAEHMGWIKYSHFLKEKIGEETGHENWPKQDLKNHFSDVSQDAHVTPATQTLLNYIRSLVEGDPRFYLSYMSFVEYFTVLAAPEFINNLETKCGISRAGMTAITNHQISDQDHIEEDLAVITDFGDTPEVREKMLRTLDESARLVGEVLNSCIAQRH